MNLKLKRRRFGQLAIASAATATITNFANKSIAQTSLLVYGLAPDSAGTGLILQGLNLATGEIIDLSTNTRGFILKANERLSGFTVLPDKKVNKTFRWSTGPAKFVTKGKPDKLSRLASRGASLNTKETLPGLPAKGAIDSLLATNDQKLIGLVGLNQGTPPFRLVAIDDQLGRVSFNDQLLLPENRRFSNLTQCPDGTIYATALGPEGDTSLVKIDLVNKSPITGKGKIIPVARLSFQGKPINNDLLALACSPSNQLFALGDPLDEGKNSLFSVNPTDGVMTLLRQFNVAKIAFAR